MVSVKLDEAGEFRMVAVAKDDSGRESKAGTSFYAWADVYFNWPHTNNDRMQIIADKPSYKVGDIAKLIVKTPYQGQGVKALITVERENVISKKIIDVTANAMPDQIASYTAVGMDGLVSKPIMIADLHAALLGEQAA